MEPEVIINPGYTVPPTILFLLLTPHRVGGWVGGGVWGGWVGGVGVTGAWEEAQQRVKSNPANPQGLLMAARRYWISWKLRPCLTLLRTSPHCGLRM